MRQHLIVAQTINSVCRSWPGAPKVGATSGGWLVSGPTGATEAVSTVEALWSAVLRSGPEAWVQELHHAADGPGVSAGSGASTDAGRLEVIADMDQAGAEARDLSSRVLKLGQYMNIARKTVL
ncbi:hypothetical protein [Arthrobacter sp. NPDC058192]|uniref:hypothetical protein n=1 Tax=Arthrobacter sp. NPDC058192 TaxID=3346372 RepID=UPI0036E3627A